MSAERPSDALVFRCEDCAGEHCRDCGGRGESEITGCPMELLTPDVLAIGRMVNAWEDQKLPPIAGGYLDQTQSFLDALAFMQAESARRARVTAKQGR